MNKELLMLYGARHAVLQMLKDGNISFSKQMVDGSCQTVDLTEICNYLFNMIESCKENDNGRE